MYIFIYGHSLMYQSVWVIIVVWQCVCLLTLNKSSMLCAYTPKVTASAGQ